MDRHPNLRVAYVAQHAFHHLEEHLDISPNRQVWGGVGGSVGGSVGEGRVPQSRTLPSSCSPPAPPSLYLAGCAPAPPIYPHTLPPSLNPPAHDLRVLPRPRIPCCLCRYILRRYSGGEDREESSKVHRVMTQEEWEKVKKQV